MLKLGQKAEVIFSVVPLETGLFEFSHISWTFFKMTSLHFFKEPWETKSPLKSLYFKLNVIEDCGRLKAAIKHAGRFYEGEDAEISVQL